MNPQPLGCGMNGRLSLPASDARGAENVELKLSLAEEALGEMRRAAARALNPHPSS